MIRILAVGRMKEEGARSLAQEYQKRICAYEKVQIEEVKEEKGKTRMQPSDVQEVLRKEGDRLLERIRPAEYVVLLDLRGESVDSESFAKKLEEIRASHGGTIDFLIGGSWGTDERVRKRADWKWQLSPLTFPHQIARVLALEQIYRAFRILRGEPYHK